MKRKTWIAIAIILVILFVLCTFDLDRLNQGLGNKLWLNIKILSHFLSVIYPILICLFLIVLIGTTEWKIQFKELSFAGLHIYFASPEKLFISKVSNYLNTKRTIFKIDLEKDNFKETFDSFYEIYLFMRNELSTIENFSELKQKKKCKDLYCITNEAVSILNSFLTEHQSNFRRWYEYYEKTQLQAGEKASFYLNPIGQFQKDYYAYEKLCSDFKHVNDFFSSTIAEYFKIDISKWNPDVNAE